MVQWNIHNIVLAYLQLCWDKYSASMLLWIKLSLTFFCYRKMGRAAPRIWRKLPLTSGLASGSKCQKLGSSTFPATPSHTTTRSLIPRPCLVLSRVLLLDWRRDWLEHLLLNGQGKCQCPCYGDDQVVWHKLVSKLLSLECLLLVAFCGIGLTFFITLFFAATLLFLSLAQAPSSHTLHTRLSLSTRRQRRYVAVTTDTLSCL